MPALGNLQPEWLLLPCQLESQQEGLLPHLRVAWLKGQRRRFVESLWCLSCGRQMKP